LPPAALTLDGVRTYKPASSGPGLLPGA